MEQHIIVKTEADQSGDEEVLLFYVDEDGNHQQGILATQNALQGEEQLNQDNMYVIDENFMAVEEEYNPETHGPIDENFTDTEIQQILIFYNDNKETFLTGATTAYNLWTIACNNMITTKTAHSCLFKLEQLKQQYVQLCLNQMKNVESWPYFEICHQTFYDDSSVIELLTNEQQRLADEKVEMYQVEEEEPETSQTETRPVTEPEQVIFEAVKSRPPTQERPAEAQRKQLVKKVIMPAQVTVKPSKPVIDDKVKKMLELLLKFRSYYKNDYFSKALWKSIAQELGETDSEYWHRRFMNYKQHYIRTIEKDGDKSQITWPYLKYFEELFKNDKEFQRKYVKTVQQSKESLNKTVEATPPEVPLEWDTTEVMVLSKYCFDCFHEFDDPTIPDKFLWGEIGRLLDRPSDSCKEKITELKQLHLEKYLEGDYTLQERLPLAILLDNLIAREVKKELQRKKVESIWKSDDIDVLVQFFYENMELIKDPVCYFVCFAAVAIKLKKPILSCKYEWADLVLVYKTILHDKKEDTEMQVDWRYIELFDSMFNYGMDHELLDGFDKTIQEQKSVTNVVAAKKLENNENSEVQTNGIEKVEMQPKTSSEDKKIDLKDKKLLEFFIKNKAKFGNHPRLKVMAWKPLANSWGWSSAQCMQRYKEIRTMYLSYLQKEISNPGKQIQWPYYDLSKKAYGYRALKSKLKNSKDEGNVDDWSPKQIVKLIKHLSQNFTSLNDNGDRSKWYPMSREIGRTDYSCHEKFLELRKSYRKLSTMKARNPDVNVSWLYYNMMDSVYNSKPLTIDEYEEIPVDDDIKNTLQEDDDFQCIIVIPEESESTSQDKETDTKSSKWTNRSKKKLLIVYLNYLRTHKGQEIQTADMWTEIAAKFIKKTPSACKKMFIKMKMENKNIENGDDETKQNSPYYELFQKIYKARPKFVRQIQGITSSKTYKDCVLDDEQVNSALQYYLEHVEEFNSPQYEQKYLWNECATFAKAPLNKVYNKINYMKKQINIVNSEIDGKETPYSDILKQIIVKESEVIANIEPDSNAMDISESEDNENWNDDETEALLSVYLTNLDKFKNPKYNKSFLWKEVANILRKNAVSCSKRMQDCRAQYRIMVKQDSTDWKFYEICQKIYGTGRKGSTV